jgi:hypothetical protein
MLQLIFTMEAPVEKWPILALSEPHFDADQTCGLDKVEALAAEANFWGAAVSRQLMQLRKSSFYHHVGAGDVPWPRKSRDRSPPLANARYAVT